jgi:NAD(P) transhydrogenase subunit alpha
VPFVAAGRPQSNTKTALFAFTELTSVVGGQCFSRFWRELRGPQAVAHRVGACFNVVSHPNPSPQFTILSMTNLEPKLFVFLLSTFLGLEVIRRVSPLLHTPLMSLTNAISAIAVVAAIQVISDAHTNLSTVLGTLAVIAATTNIVGGFWITDRMLKMFRRETNKK